MRRQLPCVLLLLAAASMLGHAASPPSTFGIAGVVVDALSGEPVNGATVTISAVASVEQTQTLLTSFDGRFRFSGLPSAKYRLSASRRGYAPQ